MIKRLEKQPTPEEIELSIQRDSCGRNEDIVQFVKLLGNIEGPYCIMLDSPWGDGKTFFVRSVEHVLKHLNSYIVGQDKLNRSELAPVTSKLEEIADGTFLPFYFNAWENDFFDDPLSPLFASMMAEFDGNGITDKEGANVLKILGKALDAASFFLRAKGISLPPMSGAVEALGSESLIDAFKKRKEIRSRVDELAEACRHEVADKLVIFIDELDRCRPDFAVRLLEQTKNIFQSDGIILVISTDSRQLAKAVGGMYGIGFDSSKFLERFYDLRMMLSPVDSYSFVYGENGAEDLFSSFGKELLKSKPLVIRDCMRLGKLEEARKYCHPIDGKTGATLFVKCILLPLLVFIEYQEPEMFRRITREGDYEALYEYGKGFQYFTETVKGCVRNIRSKGGADIDSINADVTDDEKRQYVTDICRIIFDSDRRSEELYKANMRTHQPYKFYEKYHRVCTLLEFPTEDDTDQGLRQTV